MADAGLSFAIETLGNILIQEGKLLSGVEDQVEEMRTEHKWMQCFLKEAEKCKGENELVRNWVSEIREATYDVEDLIEGFVLRSALRNQKGVVNRFKKYAYKHVGDLHQVGSRIKAIKAKLTTLRTRLKTYGIRELKVDGEEISSTGKRKSQDYPHVVDPNIVGLDEKITELVERLVHRGGPGSVVCLHGMGGVGKTTTAKKVYGDRRIKAHFEGFAWVFISQQCNPRQVWESILTELSDSKEDVKSMSDNELTSKLCGLQKNKRCLLVIDDIWSSEDWVKLSPAFPYMDKNSQSKMLVTTRNEGVASYGVHVYRTNLNVLDHSNSWRLLTDTILFQGGHDHPIKEDSNMQKYAGEMVEQCGGLPLAIIVLGGILAPKHDLHMWEKVGSNIKSIIKRREPKGVSSVLESSYEDLPYNLRSCFLYFSQYREDEEIKTTELKQKWIAEGFVPSSAVEGDVTTEDIAEEYLDELVHRCMIQVGRKGHTRRVKTCRIHDLMRDLCISKAKEEGFGHTIELGSANEGTNFKKISFRRLCISSCNHKLGESVVSSLGRIPPQLRSVWFQDNLDDDQCEEAMMMVKKLKFVRVLELPSTMWTLMGKTKSGRKHLGNLIHLRFLNLKVSMLPTTIGNLICLQTLNLGRCNSNLIIPDLVWQMVQLRHLCLPKDGGVCESGKQVIADFKNLQTLVNFPPENFDLKQNLVKFVNVRKLVITNRCEEISKILRSEVMDFNRLESLSFTGSSANVDLEAVTGSCPCLYRLVVNAPIKFTPIWPSNLTKLVLRCYGLDITHIRSLGKLQRLKVLFLCDDSFSGEKMMFYKNEFPQLNHLLVEELNNLRSWGVHEGGLPSLCCLEIVNCMQLKSVPDGFQYLKQLKELKVTSMPYVFRKKLEKGGEDWKRVRNVPSISFSHCYGEENGEHRSSNILDESSSLELLKKTILFSGGPDHPIRENSEMDICAIEMVKICGEVLVAITILGGILGTKHEIEEWESIKSILKEGEQNGNDLVTSVLELSYADLPCNLKSSFLSFAEHEKNEEIKATEMTQKWIGQGFIASSMEDVGQEYLNELVTRCLIQGERNHRGRVKTCRMHEFVWHFCVSKAEEEGFAFSLPFGADLTLKLEGSDLSKYFGNLRYLQTLNLESCVEDLIIPDSVWGLEQLRHLYLPWGGSVCESNRQQVGDFSNLRALVNFPPSNFDLQQNLVKFSNVRKLVIRSWWVGEIGRILRSQGIVFNRLQSLSFMYNVYEQQADEVDLEAFTRGSLSCLYRLVVYGSIKLPAAPSCTSIWPPNLTKLVLRRTNIDQSQLGSLAKLESLQVLFLQSHSFVGKEMVFHTNDFLQLRHLQIFQLEDLETWAVHEGALSNLLCLEIVYCKKLKSVPDGFQYLKQLKELKVTFMTPSFTERLKEGGEDWDRVSHVPSISFIHCD